MSTMTPPTIGVEQDPRWDDPERCPFCGSLLADGGAGFIDHTDESPSCKAAFDRDEFVALLDAKVAVREGATTSAEEARERFGTDDEYEGWAWELSSKARDDLDALSPGNRTTSSTS